MLYLKFVLYLSKCEVATIGSLKDAKVGRKKIRFSEKEY